MFRDMAAELALVDTPALSAARPTDAAAAAPDGIVCATVCGVAYGAAAGGDAGVAAGVAAGGGHGARLEETAQKAVLAHWLRLSCHLLLFFLVRLSVSLRCTSARDELVCPWSPVCSYVLYASPCSPHCRVRLKERSFSTIECG